MPVAHVVPKNFIFEVTPRCNCRCRYCYNVWKANGFYPHGELGFWQIKKLLKKVLKETGAKLITLTGGEPLLRKDLEKIVKFLTDRQVGVNLITNGTLLTERRIISLVSLGVANFELPLLSSRRDAHNKLMGLDSFDVITEAIVKIKKYQGKVVTVFVATKENSGDFAETIKLAFALGTDGIMFNRFNPGGDGAKHLQELMPSVQQIKEALSTGNDFAGKYGIGIACSIPIQPCLIDVKKYKNVSFGFCAAGTENSYYTIDPVGNLRMCNHSNLILGNLFTESFQDIMSKDIAHDFVRTAPSYCNACTVKDTCLGGCKAAAEVCFGSFTDNDPFLEMNKVRSYGAGLY